MPWSEDWIKRAAAAENQLLPLAHHDRIDVFRPHDLVEKLDGQFVHFQERDDVSLALSAEFVGHFFAFFGEGVVEIFDALVELFLIRLIRLARRRLWIKADEFLDAARDGT